MTLFYCGTYYQLLFGIVYCMKRKENEDVVFIVDDFLYNSEGIIDRIKEKELVKEVYHVPFIAIRENTLEWVMTEAKKQIDRLPIKIEDFEEIYVAASHSWFGIYLAKNAFEFFIVEECCGILSKIDKLRENVAKTSKKQDEYAQTLGLYLGDAEYIKRIICSSSNDVCILEQEKLEFFDLVEEMMQLSDVQLGVLIDIFCDSYMEEGCEESVLLLTQHFANLNILEWEEQQDLYKILLDYFTNPKDKIYIKSHPADIMDYENFISECKHIKEKIPSEFLPFVFETLPKKIMTVSSTAIDGIGDVFENRIVFDFWFEQWFDLVHNYYCAVEQVRQYINNGYKVYAFGVNNRLLENVCKFACGLKESLIYLEELEEVVFLPGKSIVFIDDFYEEKSIDFKFFAEELSNSVICIYLNSKFSYTFCQKEIVEWMANYIPVFVDYKQDDKLTILGRLYYFSKGEITNMVEVRKKLKYENAIIYTQMFEGDELKIKILEGMLRATEERLRFYLEEDKNESNRCNSSKI